MKDNELTDFEMLELLEYEHRELVEIFTRAIEHQVARGILSPAEAKEYLTNIGRWLRESMEN